MCLGKNLERKREKICLGNDPKLPKFFFFNFFLSEGGLGVFITKK